MDRVAPTAGGEKQKPRIMSADGSKMAAPALRMQRKRPDTAHNCGVGLTLFSRRSRRFLRAALNQKLLQLSVPGVLDLHNQDRRTAFIPRGCRLPFICLGWESRAKQLWAGLVDSGGLSRRGPRCYWVATSRFIRLMSACGSFGRPHSSLRLLALPFGAFQQSRFSCIRALEQASLV